MIVVGDISAPLLDFDVNAPEAAGPCYERAGQQWEGRPWRFFTLVFRTDHCGVLHTGSRLALWQNRPEFPWAFPRDLAEAAREIKLVAKPEALGDLLV